MRKQIAILFVAISISFSYAHADLIDVVSFRFQDGVPAAYYDFLNQTAGPNLLFFDEARSTPYTINGVTYPPGWVSQFGVLNGGQYFFTDLFSRPPDVTAQVSWNFTGSDKWLVYMDLFGIDSDGNTWDNLYRVPYGYRLDDLDTVELNGIVDIIGISFYGTDPLHVPDSGSTAVYLVLSLIGVGVCRRTHFRRLNTFS